MKQLNPKSRWLFFVRYLLISFYLELFAAWIIFAIVMEGGKNFYYWPLALIWLILAYLAFILIGYIWAQLSYHFYRYELTDSSFKKELGVIYKKYVSIPYDRIQNVDIYRGIWARILGLSDLHIQTAGASGANRYSAFSEGRLPGLLKDEAEELRDELINRVRSSKANQGL